MKSLLSAALACVALGSSLVSDEPKPLEQAPLAYFSAHCSRCHGANGMNYAPDASKWTEVYLKKEISDMASGPGGQAIAGIDLDAQVALHRAIALGKPFVSWTRVDGQTLSGETTPGAKLTLGVGDSDTPVTVDDDGNWKAKLPTSMSPSDVSITAKSSHESSVLWFKQHPFSTF